jgi:hypothetical protein
MEPERNREGGAGRGGAPDPRYPSGEVEAVVLSDDGLLFLGR